jgi:hypothetical protein
MYNNEIECTCVVDTYYTCMTDIIKFKCFGNSGKGVYNFFFVLLIIRGKKLFIALF